MIAVSFLDDPRTTARDLLAHLRGPDVQVTVGDEIRVTVLLEHLRAAGRAPLTPEALSRALTPVLARNRQAQETIGTRITAWAEARQRREDMQVDDETALRRLIDEDTERRRRDARNRVLMVVAGAAASLLMLAVGFLALQPVLPDGGGPGPLTTSNGALDTRRLEVLMWLAFPFVCALLWCLSRLRAPGVMTRETGLLEDDTDLPVPRLRGRLFSAAPARAAAQALARSVQVQSHRLDVPRSIRATIRNGSVPEIRYRTRAQRREYLLVIETGGAGDHIRLLEEPLVARLREVAAQLSVFEAYSSIARLRHKSGTRSLGKVATLADIAEEHRGARLIILGTGRTLMNRLRGGLSEAAGFRTMRDGRPAYFAGFEAPTLLTVTPPSRWGAFETQLEHMGIAVLPATSEGLRAAAALNDPVALQERQVRPRYHRDEFLDMLDAASERYVSEIPPPRDEADRIAAELIFYVQEVDFEDGPRVLAALAWLPDTFPEMSAYAIGFALAPRDGQGGPAGLSEEMAARLARLPWMQKGRLPDWLRAALARMLPQEVMQEARARAGAMWAALAERQMSIDHGLNQPEEDTPSFSLARPADAQDEASKLNRTLPLVERDGVIVTREAAEGVPAMEAPGAPRYLRFAMLWGALVSAVAVVAVPWLLGGWASDVLLIPDVTVLVTWAVLLAPLALGVFPLLALRTLRPFATYRRSWANAALWREGRKHLRAALRSLEKSRADVPPQEIQRALKTAIDHFHAHRELRPPPPQLPRRWLVATLCLSWLSSPVLLGLQIDRLSFLAPTLFAMLFLIVVVWPDGRQARLLRHARPRPDARESPWHIHTGLLLGYFLVVFDFLEFVGSSEQPWTLLFPQWGAVLTFAMLVWRLSRVTAILDGPALGPRVTVETGAIAAALSCLAVPLILYAFVAADFFFDRPDILRHFFLYAVAGVFFVLAMETCIATFRPRLPWPTPNALKPFKCAAGHRAAYLVSGAVALGAASALPSFLPETVGRASPLVQASLMTAVAVAILAFVTRVVPSNPSFFLRLRPDPNQLLPVFEAELRRVEGILRDVEFETGTETKSENSVEAEGTMSVFGGRFSGSASSKTGPSSRVETSGESPGSQAAQKRPRVK